MEDTLRVYLSDYENDAYIVLILVVMEDTLRANMVKVYASS